MKNWDFTMKNGEKMGISCIIELDDGTFLQESPINLMVKTMVFCKFPLNQSSECNVNITQISPLKMGWNMI